MDAGLVDRMGAAHHTKRAAIIAGLRLLDSGEVESLRAQAAGLEQELASAKAALAAAQATAATASPKLDKANADLAAERAEHRRTHKALDKSQAAMQEAQASLRRAQKDIASLQAERERLAALVPHHAYCGSCDKLVPEIEWDEQPARAGVDIYHKPDGYRAKSGLVNPATVLFWRAKPGQAAR